MPDKSSAIDEQNRHIEQQAQTDSDLETVVPPTSPFGGATTWWRIAIVIVALLVIGWIISQAL